LHAGLDALEELPASESVDAVLVTLVDLPWQSETEAVAVMDLLDHHAPAASLGRLVTPDGAPGHPVLIGRDHWGPLREELRGDEGARGYLARAAVRTVRT
jgi:CTP:molybdopterin cytidylyltransferase MocA